MASVSEQGAVNMVNRIVIYPYNGFGQRQDETESASATRSALSAAWIRRLLSEPGIDYTKPQINFPGRDFMTNNPFP